VLSFAAMKNTGRRKADQRLTERLGAGGLRSTPQREHIYDVLLQKRDHPTAEEVFIRAKRSMPDISMATVYNCLDALVQCGLVRQVQIDRGATRFCPNMQEHGHFYCDGCDTVYDVDLPAKPNSRIILPHGFTAEHFEVAIHGICPECAKKKRKAK
jgi:Fur family transcriptional regulator, peroxide stress response regulator